MNHMNSETLVVYRIEHSYDGFGPYQTCYPEWLNMSCKLCTEHSCDSLHPAPTDEEEDLLDSENYRNYKFGVLSLDSLKEWFSGWLEELHTFGFKLKVCMVDPDKTWMINGNQVIFDDACCKTYTISISSLL